MTVIEGLNDAEDMLSVCQPLVATLNDKNAEPLPGDKPIAMMQNAEAQGFKPAPKMKEAIHRHCATAQYDQGNYQNLEICLFTAFM